MTTLPAWREVARPRRDIADGTFDESLFAADLGTAARGGGAHDYRDAVTFCEKTYLTDNLRQILGDLVRRLGGDLAAPGVYRLQTEFGGGKTHTMLAAYHLFRDPTLVAGTALAGDLRASLGGAELPQARVVVLDGGDLLVGKTEPTPEGIELHTLLGHLAYGLGKAPAYARVAEQDQRMLGTATHQLVELLEAHAPCLILLDETLEYLAKARSVKADGADLVATTLTVIKELCTAVSNVRGAALLVTLTGSHLEDYAGVIEGEELYDRLSKVVGRTENIISPVEGDDIFPILHRRLFETIGRVTQREGVADAYLAWYEQLGDAVPPIYRDGGYRDRLAAAYPFHPELIDILTNRWSSLSGWQRTRGALRLLSHTVKALSRQGHAAPLIHVGDVPLADPGVRGEVLKVAGDSYKAALNADIIRSDAKAPEYDSSRGGQVEAFHLATGLATTAFLHSHGSDRVLGASVPQMLVGVGRPGLSRGLIDDVRDTLEGLLWYMRLESGRYRFTTKPNLNRIIVGREHTISEERIEALVRETIAAVAQGDPILRVRDWVTESTDLRDEQQLTLGVLDFARAIGGESTDETKRTAHQILSNHGSAFRTNKNAAMLLAADTAQLAKARASARTLAAVRDVKDDSRQLASFTTDQKEQLDKRLAIAEERLPHQVVITYRHLLLLGASDHSAPVLDHVDLGPARVDARLGDRVLDYLRSADRIIETKLAPAALLSPRFGLLPDDTDVAELDVLLGHFAHLPRLPKLGGPDVLRAALVDGVRAGLFGLASGSRWDAEDAVLRFEEPVDPREVDFQPGTFLVRASAIRSLLAVRRPVGETKPAATGTGPEAPTSVGAAAGSLRDSGRTASTGGAGSQTRTGRPGEITALTLHVTGVSATQMRDVLKVAVLPLASESIETTIDVTIHVRGGLSGIPREVLNLTVLEGLRQLGLTFDLKTDEDFASE